MRLFALAAAGAAAAALTACADMGMGGGSETASGAATGSGTSAAATAPSDATPTAAAAPTSAMDYVTEAARSDMYEIQSSQLAASRSASARVKDFAATMIRDHTNSTQLVKATVSQAGMSPPAPPSLDTRRQGMLDQLTGASGADFDRLYLHQQLMAHQEALALHQGYAQNGDQSALRTVAGQIAPIVQQHLTMLQGMGAA